MRFAIFKAEGGDFGKYAVKSADAGKLACFPASIGE